MVKRTKQAEDERAQRADDQLIYLQGLGERADRVILASGEMWR